MTTAWTVGAIATRLGLRLEAEDAAAAAHPVHGVASLESAGPFEISFFANPRYRQALGRSRAAAIVLASEDRADCSRPALLSPAPYLDFARIAALFEQHEPAEPGIHASAVVDPSAAIDPSASIGPHCTVGARSRILAGARLGPGCVVGPDCVVGEHCQLIARVTLVCRVQLGRRVLIHPGAVLGADGFGLARGENGWVKVPQLGGVRVGDDCEIGANTTIDRGALGDTVLGRDVRIDNLVQIAHNCEIGDHTAIAACVGIAGSARLGRNVRVAGAAGIAGHLSVADGTMIQAMSMVTHTIHEPGSYASGSPLMSNAAWKRNMARLRHLDALYRRVVQLEKALAGRCVTGSSPADESAD